MGKSKALAKVGLTLVAALVLAGCSTTATPTDTSSSNSGKPTTHWRESGSQTPVDPNSGAYVDHSDTSRQDGAKDIKFITENVTTLNTITGKKQKTDEETIFNAEVTSITPLGHADKTGVYSLEMNSKGKYAPASIAVEDVERYSISLKLDYASGYKDPGNGTNIPLFWPVSESGALGYIDNATSATPISANGVKQFTIVVAMDTGAGDPVGVRYMQFNDRVNEIIAPVTSIYPKGAIVVSPPSSSEKSE